jgi:hypothetical protein
MNTRAFATMSQSPTWNGFQNGLSGDSNPYNWEADDETDPVLKMYREMNMKLEEENAVLKRKLFLLERQHESVSNQLQQMKTDVANYNASKPIRPSTPVSPAEGLTAMESEVVYWQRKIGRSPPRLGNLSRLVPPRFQNLTSPTGGGAAAASSRKTPDVTVVQKDDVVVEEEDEDDEMFRSLKAAYERGCEEVGFGGSTY